MWQDAHADALIEAGLLTQAEVDGGGLAQVEIDALTAIIPEELDRMAEAAIAPYLDATLAGRTDEARIEWEREARGGAHGGGRSGAARSPQPRRAADRQPLQRLLRSLERSKDRLDAIEAAMIATWRKHRPTAHP